MLTQQDGSVAWWSVGTLSFDLEPSVAADLWTMEKVKTYKMQALLLILLPGKHGLVVKARLKFEN